MKTLSQVDQTLNRIERWLLILLLGSIVTIAFLQVVLRYFWSIAIPGGDVIARHLVVPTAFIGAALAVGEGRHVGADIITPRLPVRFRRPVKAAILFIAGFVSLLLGKAALSFASIELEGVEIHFEDLPSWITTISMPVGYGLLTIHCFISGILAFSRRRDEPS